MPGDRNKMGFSWNLRKYQKGDEQAIVELLNIAFGRRHSLEYLKWKYKENPAGPAIVWLAEHDNKIIGHYGIVPTRIKMGNKYMIGSFGWAAATHPEYQGKGVFSSIVNKCYLDAAQNDIPLTWGFANINLGPTYKRYEWRGHICLLINMIKVLDWENLLSRYIHNKFLARSLSHVFSKVLRPTYIEDSVKIEKIDRFDERINRLWEEISKHFQIIVKRDQRYLNWRYVEDPDNEYTIYTAERDNKILGYCVLNEAQQENLKYGFISDILGFHDHCNVVVHLIRRALKHFEENDVDVASCVMSEKHSYKAIFGKAGFFAYPRSREALVATINLKGSSIDEKSAYSQALLLSQNYFLKKKRNWFIISGDGT